MENEIALIAAGFFVARIAVIVAFGYLFYRVLRAEPRPIRARVQSRYARERAEATRFQR